MADSIHLEVATPERLLVDEVVTEAQIPAKDGYIGVLPGHAPLVGLLGAGTLSYAADSHRRSLAVAGGFLEVLPDRVRVVADVAERAEEIDAESARKALEAAQAEVAKADPDADPAAAVAAVGLAQARVDTAARRTG